MSQRVRISPAGRSEGAAFPLSPCQQAFGLASLLENEIALNNVGYACRLSGRLSREWLHLALATVMKRHEAFRTRVLWREGSFCQVVDRQMADGAITWTDLRALESSVRERRMNDIGRDELRRPFRLDSAPLARFHLVVLDDNDYALMISIHHLIADGWSLGIFLREVTEVYKALAEARKAELPELPVQYVDYAVWLGNWVKSQDVQKHIDYWRQELKDLPKLRFPHHDRRADHDGGSVAQISLSRQVRAQIEAFSKREGVTPFNLFIATLHILLAHQLGQPDFAIGVPVANRRFPELRNVIGCFINTLLFRNDISANPVFRDFLEATKHRFMRALAHQQLPYETMAQALEDAGDGRPMPNVLLVQHIGHENPISLDNVAASSFEIHGGVAKFDLRFLVTETHNDIHLQLTGKGSVITSKAATRLLQQWQHLISEAVARPVCNVAEFGGSQRTLGAGNVVRIGGAHCGLNALTDLCEVFELAARRRPDAIAVISGPTRWTYAELRSRAARLAHALRNRGAGPEVLVGIYMPRCAEMVVAVLATLMAGAAYVPLDVRWPQERVHSVVENTRMPIVLTTKGAATELAWNGLEVVALDETCFDKEQCTVEVAPNSHPESAAYVIFTSGSTGKPKGVVVERRQLMNYVRAFSERVDVAEGDSFAMLQPLSVDSCKTVLITSLSVGGCLHVIGEDLSLDGERLAQYFESAGIDFLKIAPSHLATLHRIDNPARLVPRRCLVVGGESSTVSWLRRVIQMRPGCAVYNHYGPTEATVGVSMYFANQTALANAGATVPLGTTLGGCESYILDCDGRAADAGTTGELYIGGDCVARGYLDRADQTAERFQPNPFSMVPGARMYRTGDLARCMPDGNIEFHGRRDQQIKIRGHRIETAEIEAALIEHPSVTAAVVSLFTADDGEARLLAYIVTDKTIESAELRSFLKRKLPEYMLPATFVFMDALPRTLHGKVDRAALPGPCFQTASSLVYVAPRDDVESAIAAIWCEVLKQERIGVSENFFDLGGHSLHAAQIITRLRHVFPFEVTARTLFDCATIADLAVAIRSAASSAAINE